MTKLLFPKKATTILSKEAVYTANVHTVLNEDEEVIVVGD